jgi:hypothetical protein
VRKGTYLVPIGISTVYVKLRERERERERERGIVVKRVRQSYVLMLFYG